MTEGGFEVPKTRGVRLHHVLTVNLDAGTIQHVVNGVGGQVDNSNTGRRRTSPSTRSGRRAPPPQRSAGAVPSSQSYGECAAPPDRRA